MRRLKDRPDRVRKRVDRQRLATNGSSLDQRQANQRTVEPSRVRLDDPIAINRKPNKSEFSPASRITNNANHRTRLATSAASAGFAGARPQPLLWPEKHHGARSAPVFRP
jgi:hypothetical protein